MTQSEEKMTCKRHKWRVGAQNAELVDGKIKPISLNIWCEKCDKKIKAKFHSDLVSIKWTHKRHK